MTMQPDKLYPLIEQGQSFLLYVNQGLRRALALGINGDEMLVEYQMPNRTTALRIVNIYDNPRVRSAKVKNVSYAANTWKKPYYFAFIENAALNNRKWIGFPAYSTYKPRPPSLKRTYEQALQYHREVRDDQRQRSQSKEAQPRTVRSRRNHTMEQGTGQRSV